MKLDVVRLRNELETQVNKYLEQKNGLSYMVVPRFEKDNITLSHLDLIMRYGTSRISYSFHIIEPYQDKDIEYILRDMVSQLAIHYWMYPGLEKRNSND